MIEFRPDFPERMAQALVSGMEAAGVYLVGRIRRDINRGNRLGIDPSKPGEPPKKVTGRLFKSIASFTKREGHDVVTYVGTNVFYGRHLELGVEADVEVREHLRQGRLVRAHRRRWRLLPRPFLRPAIIRHRRELARIVAMRIAELTRIYGEPGG
ncbi:MAG: hypothetical protein NZM12_10920 [Steroidobacteraceae bacterium]|nr:hypothetical protein [Steroidobacteraceae bacterium]MDW8260765.1 hypothetical protein [Gammaproteobacteria bacterium]